MLSHLLSPHKSRQRSLNFRPTVSAVSAVVAEGARPKSVSVASPIAIGLYHDPPATNVNSLDQLQVRSKVVIDRYPHLSPLECVGELCGQETLLALGKLKSCFL